MAYTLNDIDLSDYGFIPGRAPASNVAVGGCWDMPGRTGLVSHSWGDEAGEEPYVDAASIIFEGRDITLYGIITADTASACISQVLDFQAVIDGLTDLVTLACDWGEWEVYIKDELQVDYLDQGVAVVTIRFREPVVDMSAGDALPTYTPAIEGSMDDFHDVDGLEGQSWADWGLVVMKKDDYLTRREIKTQQFTVYGEEGYQVTKPKSPWAKFTYLVQGADYAAFKSVLNTFQKALKTEGLRYFTQGEIAIAAAWAKDGYKVDQVHVDAGGAVTGRMVVTMILVPFTPDPDETMLDSDGEAMMDLDSQLMLDIE